MPIIPYAATKPRPAPMSPKATGPLLTNRSIAEAATLRLDVDRLAAYQRALERLRSRKASSGQRVGLFIVRNSREEDS